MKHKLLWRRRLKQSWAHKSFLPLVAPSRYQAASAFSAREHRHHAVMQVLPSSMSPSQTQFYRQHDPSQPPDVVTSIRKTRLIFTNNDRSSWRASKTEPH
nr:hypothetical protein [uncultured Sphingomonas sp.]